MRLLEWVNPLQGTASVMKFSNGNTLPFIARPFGMVSWSPQTNEAGERWFFHLSTGACKAKLEEVARE